MNIHESVHHILQQEGTFADLFYLVFLEQFPDVRKHFEKVNMKHQGVLLTMALTVMERHYSGDYAATRMYLQYLGTKHHDRGIPAESFPKFQEALLATLHRFHSTDWQPPLAEQWRTAIERAIATMLEGYRTHFSV
jgi:hemoglobin-like flavoprotein